MRISTVLALIAACCSVGVLMGCGKSQSQKEQELTKNFKGGPMPEDVRQRMNAAMGKAGNEAGRKGRDQATGVSPSPSASTTPPAH